MSAVSESDAGQSKRNVMAVGIEIAESDLTVNGQPAFCAYPTKPGRYAAAVMLPDIFGLRELAREQARRLARHGTVALYLHPLRGTGAFDPVANLEEAREKCRPFVQAVTVDLCMEDLNEGVRLLRSRDDVDPERVLLWGYCWGGSMVLRGASRVADIAGVVVWHGILRGEELGTVPNMKGSILGLFGGIDDLIPVSDVEALASACNEAGIENSLNVYPEAPHSFCDDSRPVGYRRDACEAAWKEVIAYLHTLKSSTPA